MLIDYTSSPLPANGQARSAAALAAAFTNVQTSVNTWSASVDAWLAGLTSASAAGKIVVRDANQQANVGTLSVAPAGAAFAGVAVQGAPSQSGLPYAYKTSDGTIRFQVYPDTGAVMALGGFVVGATQVIDATGAVVAAQLPVVPLAKGGTGATTAAAARAALGVPQADGAGTGVLGNAATATALAGPVAVEPTLSDYKLSTSASAGVITIAAGGQYFDSNGQAIGPLAQQTVTLPTQPTGTNFQYIGISLAPATGAPVVTAAAVNAPLATLSVPTANKGLGTVLWRGATTNPGGVVAAGDITGARNLGSGGAATGGAGVDSAARSAVVWLQGTNVTFPNANDSTTGTGTGWMHPAYVKATATAASLDDVQGAWIQPDIVGHISWSGATITLNAAAASPVSVKRGKATASSSATASGASGPRYIIYDPATQALVTPMPAAASTTGAQTILGAVAFDGANLQPGTFIDWSYLFAGFSTQDTLVAVTATDDGTTWSGGSSAGAYTEIPHMATVTFFVSAPGGCVAEGAIAFNHNTTITGTGFLAVALMVDGVQQFPVYIANASENRGVSHVLPKKIPLAYGAHTLGIGMFTSGTVSAGMTGSSQFAMLKLYKS